MSKRKATEPTGGKATGKWRAEEPEIEQDSDDLFASDALTSVVDNADALADALGDGEDDDGSYVDGEDDLLAAALADADGEDDDDDDDDEPESVSGAAEEDEPALPEPGELPEGVTLEQLQESEVDLTGCGELTIPQARRIALCLATNSALTCVKVGSSELAVGDLKEEGELEWDSEEYTDVEAIIIAELLKANTSVSRLDLARNQIADAGACALAEMLTCNSTIEYLNLESNTFGERGGKAFLEALGGNSSLQYLNLMYNSVPSGTQGSIRQAWQASSRAVGLHL